MHYFTPRRCAATSKIMYHDRVKAQQAADRSMVERDVLLWVYRCDYCGSWHLTSHEPGSYQRMRAVSRASKPHSRKRGYKPRRR
ncbi:hypothetical protein H3U87_02975 [Bifidobacterium sp. W8101]|uniref:hypothetical protein n=1 Tax=Bifidobacterium TaxID=1678 RepID=UPI0018DD9461|nr:MULTISPECIES: hypothetical protein [Bifidobacterium]MBI0126106.1 hypothetical protein [Bifidobacterium choladohabitans]MBI0127675.1 hypothetical protein [Bifidobacterium sp. W8103]MBI0138263.1 hypothetical protein [Bifidobacterium sp. W8105]MBI0148767.1 hypothetical protein [Bifidobacterium sp. W8107]